MHLTRSSLPRLTAAVLTPLLFFVALAAWALSSQVGATPDDDFHLPAIWCGLGERDTLCEVPSGEATFERIVPAPLADVAFCFAFRPEMSGGCWDSSAPGMKQVERANADGLYPPVFYGVFSLLAGPDVPASVIAMRLTNAAFAVGFLTAVFFALPRAIRPALVVSVLATSVPLGVFLFASTNPSSWAVLSAATVWITTYAATQTTGRRRIVLAALVLLSTVIGAGARADAAVYAVFGLILGLALGLRGIRTNLIALVAALVAAAMSVMLYLSAWQGGAVVGGIAAPNDTVDSRPPLSVGQLASNVLEIPGLWMGALGDWGLGWLDTSLPSIVTLFATAVFGGALLVGLRRVSIRRAIGVTIALSAMWGVPFVLLFQSRAVVGELVQPRYILPLLVIALGIASLRPDATAAWRGMRLWLAGTALAFAFAVALRTNIQRYVTGTDEFHANLDHDTEWWWQGAPSPMTTWIIGTIAFLGGITLLALAAREPARRLRERASVAEPLLSDADPAGRSTT